MSIQPVVPNLPAATTAFTNKYTTGSLAPQNQSAILSALSQLPLPRPATPTNTINPLALYEATRANRGISPLTPRQSAAALRTLATGKPATPPRRQGFWKSALGDLRSLVGGIPKLPLSLYHEATQLPNAPEAISRAVSESSSPLNAIGNIAAAPGVRMVPGAFIAQQLGGDTGQGLQGILAHPLFSALDVLPAASAAARALPVSRAARAEVAATNAARAQQAAATTGAAGNARLLPNPRPLATALTRTLDESGAVVPNRLGRALAESTDAFYSTSAGRGFQATFKERDVPRLESRFTSTLRKMANLDNPRSSLPQSINGRSIAPELDLRDRVIQVTRQMENAGIDAARSTELYDMATNPRLPDGTPTSIDRLPGLTDAEQAVLTEIRDIQAERARLTEGDLTRTVTIDGTPEVYDIPTARKLSAIQQSATTAREFARAREAVLNPQSINRDAIVQAISDIETRRASGSLSKSTADDLTRTYRAALDEQGWVWDEATDTLQQVARPTMNDLITALNPYRTRYPTIPRLIDHLQRGMWSTARKELDQFAATRAGQVALDTLPFDIDGLKAELSRLIARDRTLARTSKFTPKYLERIERLQSRAETRAVPARYASSVQSAAERAITARVRETYTGSPDLDAMVEMASNRVYDAISELGPREVRLLQREARESWRALRDAGHDPIFFSRVTPSQRARLPYIRVSDAPVTPAAAKARMWDATPYARDMGVALTSDAMQLLQRRATDAFLTEFSTTYGRTRASLVADLYPRATQRAAASPSISVQSHLDNLINERWAKWDANKFLRGKATPAFAVEGAEAIYVPRVMSENIDRLYSPPLPKLTAAFDPIMRVFRTSVLPLAPRWHIYNAIGGAVMTAIEDPMAFRYLPGVIKEMWGNRGAPGSHSPLHIEGAPPAGFGTMPAEVRAWDAEVRATSPLKDRLAASHNYAAGRKMAEWFDTAREGRISKLRTKGARALEKSYTANQMVDDMYRSAIGISAKNRVLRRGASAELADAAAVSAIRRVFQSWDEMTPMERSIMRSVVPFYGWSSHILKYAMKYPFDHPLRVSILGSFARAELTDAMTGLPDYIRDMVLIGDTRANGVVRALNVGPFNPFRDLPSNFTVAGFLGNLNPVLTGVLESVGVNVQQGGPTLYPELRYDPETGRLVADPSGNLASNILGNVLPQTNLFTALIGQNEAFNQTLARDPAAAGRQLMSNLGIPVLFRDINVGEQLIRAEMARFEDQDLARREALRTGNLEMLGDFPGLAAYGEQIRALNAAGQLDQLRPQTGAPGAASGAGLAYAAQAGLTGS